MDLYLKRFHKTKNGTTGFMFMDGSLACYTIERPWVDNQKVVSCIPIGRYEVKLRKEQTELTRLYRERYDYFVWHLWLQDVKKRTGIYIHVGNFPRDVRGCIAVGNTATMEDSVLNSRLTFKPFYSKLHAALDRGDSVKITIE